MQNQLSLGESEAQLALEVIREELSARSKVAVIAVADAYGELLALWRCDGAPRSSIKIAANKAWTAARLGETTGRTGREVRAQGWDIAFYGDPQYVGWDGGAPVRVNGKVVGAVAVSGLAEQEDIELALAAVARIQDTFGQAE